MRILPETRDKSPVGTFVSAQDALYQNRNLTRGLEPFRAPSRVLDVYAFALVPSASPIGISASSETVPAPDDHDAVPP